MRFDWLRRMATLALWIVLASAGAGRASAGLMVSVQDSTVDRSGAGRAEVLISNDSATIQLAGFIVQFELVSTNGRQLEFLDLGGGVPVDSHLTSPRYVFAGTGSAAQDMPPAGAIGPGTVYFGVDASNSTSGVEGPFVDRLLTTLHFAASTGAPPQIGDTFELRFDPIQSDFFDPVRGSIPFTVARQGTVTVVPEPTGWLLAVLGLWPVVSKGLRLRAQARR